MVFIGQMNGGEPRKAKPEWTYKFLKETPEWKNAKNPQLLYNVSYPTDLESNSRSLIIVDNKFILDDTMTARDVYSHMINNVGCNFPMLYRTVEYKNNGKIKNPYYKEINYLIEKYDIKEDESNGLEIVNGFKTPEEIYMDLDIENNNYDKIPIINKIEHIKNDISKIKYNFTEITSAEIKILDVTPSDIKALIFLAFKDKIIIFKITYNISENNDTYSIDLDENLILKNINPQDKTSLKFLNLNAIKIYKNNLYVVDSELNMILRYNISHLSLESENFNDELQLLDSLQGLGNLYDKIYFNNPYSLGVSDEYILVVDRNNNCIKKYTSSLNFVKTIKNGFFSSHSIQAVGVNPYPCVINDTNIEKDSIWIVSSHNNRIFLSILNDDIVKTYGQINDISLLENNYFFKEEIRGIDFSKVHSNYFYINTNKSIYKFHVSKPFYPIGSLNYFHSNDPVQTETENEINSEISENKCFTLVGDDSIQGDIIFNFNIIYDYGKLINYIDDNNISFNDIIPGILTGMIKSANMLFYIEPIEYLSSLIDDSLIALKEFNFNTNIKNDYINALSFNKILYPLVYNLFKIKTSLIGLFEAVPNKDNVIVFNGIDFYDYFYNLKSKNIKDYFIYNTEHFSIIINRVFENIYDLQEKIINKMQTKFTLHGNTQTYEKII